VEGAEKKAGQRWGGWTFAQFLLDPHPALDRNGGDTKVRKWAWACNFEHSEDGDTGDHRKTSTW
jgi:hypothetical protein